MQGFNFEEDRIRKEIIKLNAKKVLIQLPEGLKPEGPRLALFMEETGAVPIISADPCYGACDLATDAAQILGVDLIIHFGHSRMIKHENIPTIYVEARATVSTEAVVSKALDLIKRYRRIGLATSIQQIHTLDKVREQLTAKGKVVTIGDSGQLAYPGQVTGCNYSNVKSVADEVDAFLFVGGGTFHALGIALTTLKQTFVADPYESRAFGVMAEAKKIINQRWSNIGQAAKAKIFGVLVGLKPGQLQWDSGLRAKIAIEKAGKQACVLALREMTPETLMEFPSIDAFVNTACPRISMEVPFKFSKPVITFDELAVVFGESSWENLLRKGLLGN